MDIYTGANASSKTTIGYRSSRNPSRLLGGDQTDGSHRPVRRSRRSGRGDGGLVADRDLTDLGVVDRGGDNVGVRADDLDLSSR